MMTETVVTVQEAPHNNAAKPAADNQQQQAGPLSWIRINLDYWKTIPGIIKIVQLVLGILCMACASSTGVSGTGWFMFVAIIAFIATILWTIVYTLGVREALTLPIDWILTEFVNTAIITVLYAIAFIVQLSVWSHLSGTGRGRNIAAGVFGLFNFIAYAAGSYFLYMERKGSAAQ